MSKMPILPLETLLNGFEARERDILSAAFTTRGIKNGAKLRSNKPFKRVATFEQGCANYVWRMLCFDLVGHGKHVCMPVTADFDLYTAQEIVDGGRIRYGQPGYDEQHKHTRELKTRLDELVKRFESNLPIEAQKGILRWARAFGMV